MVIRNESGKPSEIWRETRAKARQVIEINDASWLHDPKRNMVVDISNMANMASLPRWHQYSERAEMKMANAPLIKRESMSVCTTVRTAIRPRATPNTCGR
jgi:hypothetical protein